MIARISDLMARYRDQEYDLPDRGYADPEKIKSLAAAKIAAARKAGPVPVKKQRHILRTVLLAAAFAALMSVTAYAVYQRTMADRVLEGGRMGTAQDGSAIVQYSAVGGSAETLATGAPAASGAEQYVAYSNEDRTYYSSMGKNSEYEAQKEWAEFYFSDTPLDARDMLDYSDPHRMIYGVAYGVLAEKLDAIAEKYGLRLMQSMALLHTEQEFFDALALEPFYPVAEDADGQHTFCVFDDGSFEASGLSMALPGSDTVLGFNVVRAVRGTLTDFLLLGGDPALADFETYTTASGTEVDIALEDTDSFLFADMENCHVTFWLDGRRVGLTMADLEAVADSIGFAALDEINVPAVAQNVEAGMAQNMQENPGSYREVTGKTQRVYDELGDYSLDGLLPEGWQFTISYANAAEDMAEYRNSLDDNAPAPGPADYYDNININYYHPDISGSYSSDKWVTLTYERYWGDPDRAVIRNAQAFHDRRTTSISGPAYAWETEMISCAVGGFDGYYAVSNHFGSRVDAKGTYLTWYDTDKQLLFTLSAPMPEFSVEDTMALAEDFAASIRGVPGTTPTGTVSDLVEDAPQT